MLRCVSLRNRFVQRLASPGPVKDSTWSCPQLVVFLWLGDFSSDRTGTQAIRCYCLTHKARFRGLRRNSSRSILNAAVSRGRLVRWDPGSMNHEVSTWSVLTAVNDVLFTLMALCEWESIEAEQRSNDLYSTMREQFDRCWGRKKAKKQRRLSPA